MPGSAGGITNIGEISFSSFLDDYSSTLSSVTNEAFNSTLSRTSFPVAVLSLTNIALSLLANSLLLRILHLQQTIEEDTRLMHRVSVVLQIILSIAWGGWDFGKYIVDDAASCKLHSYIFPYVTLSAFFAQLFCYSFISICKLLFITRPLKYHIMLTLKRVKVILFAIVLVAVLICIPLLPWPNLRFHYYVSSCEISFDTVWLVEIIVKAPVVTALFITSVTKIGILRVIYKHRRRLDVMTTLNDSHSAPLRKRVGRWMHAGKGVLTVLTLSISFHFCWFPWLLAFTDVGFALAVISGGVSGWLQPLLYICTTKEAKRIVRSYIIKLRLALMCNRRHRIIVV